MANSAFQKSSISLDNPTFTTKVSVTGSMNYTTFLSTGTMGFTPANPLAKLQSSVSPYNQFLIQNTNTGKTASSDVIVNNNRSTDTTYYGDFGINSGNYTGLTSFNLPNAVYLSATCGDLSIGTTTKNKIHFVTNSSATDAMTILSGGSVGIGTTAPKTTTQINVSTDFPTLGTTSGHIFLSNTTSLWGMHIGNDNNTGRGWIQQMRNDTATAYPLVLNPVGGNVGIGTTAPATPLHVYTTATNTKVAYFASGADYVADHGPSIVFRNGASEELGGIKGAFTVSSNGNEAYLSFLTRTSDALGITEKMRIAASGSIGAPNGTNIYNASDIRLKQNIVTISDGLNKVLALNPIKFNWITDYCPEENDKDMLGFIAQEVKDIIPEAVEDFSSNSMTVGDIIIDNPLRVNEKFIIPVLVKAVQEQQSQIESLLSRIETLETK